MLMHCLIIAGGSVSPDNPLYPYTQGKPKALIDMGGRTMLERVVAALHDSSYVEDVFVIGIKPEMAVGLEFARSVEFMPDQGGMVPNMLTGLEWLSQNRPGTDIILGCSADIPTITGRVVDEFVEACRPWDKGVYYNFVTRERLEERFPNSRRTYSRYGYIETAGGDMLIARVDVALRNRPLLESVTAARKQPWRVASVVGLRMLLKFLLHRVTIADVETTAERALGAPVKIILDGPPELAMDADKPFQIELLRAELAHGH
jgi:molybdopterin-guanine dinucleotide biosynthesis protein A